jgi:hypothetical protein
MLNTTAVFSYTECAVGNATAACAQKNKGGEKPRMCSSVGVRR